MQKTSEEYVVAVGRRKTASARVKMTPAKESSLSVNGVSAREYFKTAQRESVTGDVFSTVEAKQNYEVLAKVSGGGIAAQAGAVRHAIARALIKAEETLRAPLKSAGLLTRDPRAKERKKPGLRKARKAPQWSKR